LAFYQWQENCCDEFFKRSMANAAVIERFANRREARPKTARLFFMRVGTRLTLVLLAALTPVLAGYLYWTVHHSTSIYDNDMRRDLRATARSLAPAITNDLAAREWNEINDVMLRLSLVGTETALLTPDREPLRIAPGFPPGVVNEASRVARKYPFGAEFSLVDSGVNWFCQVVPLTDRAQKPIGYLVVAQDWTDITEDLRDRTTGSIIAALLVVGVIIAIIPLAVRRYVSAPLDELSSKVIGFSGDELRDQTRSGDEVTLLTEEFRRLDQQLETARRDLLEKHRRELALERKLQHAQRLATIGTLASGLAHEIGTPMGVIRGRAELLLNAYRSEEKAARGLDVIVTQIDRVTKIVRMLLDYGRSRESVRSLCDVRQILNHALTLIETEAARRKIDVLTEMGHQPLNVICDAGQLQQVFVNLAMNALDAMTPQGGTLRISARREIVNAGACLKITFADTGKGISSHHADQLFDPFFTTKEPGQGAGMGLAVSQSIMRDHGGDVTFESAPDGSRFFVSIPIADHGTSQSRQSNEA